MASFLPKVSIDTGFENDGWGDKYCFSTDIFPDSITNDMHFSHVFRLFLYKENQISLMIYCLANRMYGYNPVIALTILNYAKKIHTNKFKSDHFTRDMEDFLHSVGMHFIHAHEETHKKQKTNPEVLMVFKEFADGYFDATLKLLEKNPKSSSSPLTMPLLDFRLNQNLGDKQELSKLNNFYKELHADYSAIQETYELLSSLNSDGLLENIIEATQEIVSFVIQFILALTTIRNYFKNAYEKAAFTIDGLVGVSTRMGPPRSIIRKLYDHQTTNYAKHGVLAISRTDSKFTELSTSDLIDMQYTEFSSQLPSFRSELAMSLFLYRHNKSVQWDLITTVVLIPPEGNNTINLINWFTDMNFINQIIQDAHINEEYLKKKYGNKYIEYIEGVFRNSLKMNAQNHDYLSLEQDIDLPEIYIKKDDSSNIQFFDECMMICRAYTKNEISFDEFKKRIHYIGEKVNKLDKLVKLATMLANHCKVEGLSVTISHIEYGFNGIDGFRA